MEVPLAAPTTARQPPNEPLAHANLPRPYLIFLGDVDRPEAAKTAFGVRDWAPDATIAQWRLPGCAVDLKVPELTPAAAYRRGARDAAGSRSRRRRPS